MKNYKINWNTVESLALWIIAALVIGIYIAGCNTMAGIGKDIQAAAVGVQSEMAPD
jgi:predicted small secreted protein